VEHEGITEEQVVEDEVTQGYFNSPDSQVGWLNKTALALCYSYLVKLLFSLGYAPYFYGSILLRSF
jgi:hypothetical protein